MKICLTFAHCNFNQNLNLLNFKLTLRVSTVLFLLACLSLHYPSKAWAASASDAVVAQTGQLNSWRNFVKHTNKKSATVEFANIKPKVASPITTLSINNGTSPKITALTPVISAPLVSPVVAPITVTLASTTLPVAATASLTPISTTFSAGSAKFSVAMDDVDALGPFPSWADAKRDYGAKGDGFTDDAPAIQKALNDLGLPGKPSVLFLPSGNYKIGSTLKFKWRQDFQGYGHPGFGVVGESPETTKITWAGPVGGAMLMQDGSFNTRYSRITWDGQGSAKYGIAHWWNAKAGTQHDSASEDVDEVFQDMDIGIMGGRLGSNYGQMNSEGQVRRVKFLRNRYAGITVGSWNALDWYVFDSHFVDCGRGVTNTFSLGDNDKEMGGAGGIYVYRSLFERSAVADFHIANTSWFSMYENVSQGSRRFFQAEGMGNNSAPVIIKGNRILDTTDPVAISNGNLGPLMLIDNQIRSKIGSQAFAVNQTDWVTGRDILSIGNRYTVATPISLAVAQDRIVSIDDSVVAYSAIDSALPTLPQTPMRYKQTVFEVPAGANAKQIQTVIDTAAASGYSNPIVHLPAGPFYDLDTTLVVPALKRLQIAGDALTTSLRWRGPANKPMINLKGPSYATVRDLSLYGGANPTKAIVIDNADQVGGRIFMEGSNPGLVLASNLTSTQLTFQANYEFSGISVSNVKSLVAIGNGVVGPVTSTGNSNALIADSWYEGHDSKLFRIDSGTFTYLGGVMAPATHQPAVQPVVNAVDFTNFTGKATFVGVYFQLNSIPNGVGANVGVESTDSSILFLGAGSNKSTFFNRENPNGKGSIGLFLSKTVSPVGTKISAPEQGRSDPEYIKAMLAQARALQWERKIYTPPVGATNVHLYRIYAPNTPVGLSISGY